MESQGRSRSRKHKRRRDAIDVDADYAQAEQRSDDEDSRDSATERKSRRLAMDWQTVNWRRLNGKLEEMSDLQKDLARQVARIEKRHQDHNKPANRIIDVLMQQHTELQQWLQQQQTMQQQQMSKLNETQ
eukprot:977729-Amphidinium_carterae.1